MIERAWIMILNSERLILIQTLAAACRRRGGRAVFGHVNLAVLNTQLNMLVAQARAGR